MSRIPLPLRAAARMIPVLLFVLLLAGCGGGRNANSSDSNAVPAADSASGVAANADVTSTAAISGSLGITEGIAAVAANLKVDGEYNGVPVGLTPDGLLFRGDPKAPLVMNIWTDFQCPFCQRHFAETEPSINDEYVTSGKVRLVFRDLPIVQLHPNAPAAHLAAHCVADQGAPLFWAMYDKLFGSQGEWQSLADPQPVFERIAGEAGADVDAWKTCVAAKAKEPQIQASIKEAAALGLDGTPSFQIGDATGGEPYFLIGAQPFAKFKETLDALLAGKAPPATDQPQTSQEVPFWATAEGRAVDPNHAGYTVAGDRTRGSADAPVVVIEFTDFQCPYCKQHFQKTQPALDSRFVDTGKVRWVFKHYPLSIHPQAPAAAVAAECAADQGKFWEMEAALFGSQQEWSINKPQPVFEKLAGNLGLDVAAFTQCLADPAKQANVDADVADGKAFVQGTPTFIILNSHGGGIIPGALPLETFANEIQKAVDEEGS